MKSKGLFILIFLFMYLCAGCNKNNEVTNSKKNVNETNNSKALSKTESLGSNAPNVSSSAKPKANSNEGNAKASDSQQNNKSQTASKNKSETSNSIPDSLKGKFPDFSTKDLKSNPVDSSIFSKHKLTLVNFWIAKYAVENNEIRELSNLNKSVQYMGAQVLGVVMDAGTEDGFPTAYMISDRINNCHPNLVPTAEIENFIFSKELDFPVSFLVDSKGYIIGKPIAGPLTKDAYLKIINSTIEQTK